MGFLILILGLLLFLATHAFVTMREARAAAIERLGLNPYRALFTLFSLGSLALIVWGYADSQAHQWIQVWSPPAFMRHITVALMLPATIVLVAYFIPSHIKAWVKHPQLVTVKIWTFAHLLANGDLASILMFGLLLAWAVYALIAAKKRGDQGTTTAPAGWTNDIIVLVVGIGLYLALGKYFHPYVIGMPVFGS